MPLSIPNSFILDLAYATRTNPISKFKVEFKAGNTAKCANTSKILWTSFKLSKN